MLSKRSIMSNFKCLSKITLIRNLIWLIAFFIKVAQRSSGQIYTVDDWITAVGRYNKQLFLTTEKNH